ncbi:MAG: hydrogenase maturation protease [Bacteroidota bacterium]
MNELKTEHKVLMIGIGNSGRSDDALGWKFVDQFTSYVDLFDIEQRYQLQIEDALLLTEYKKVIFIDASHKTYKDGFSFYKCIPTRTEAFTTHKLEPETVLWLANDLFNQSPEVYVMAITGITWELHQGMSDVAQQNFEKAVAHFKKWLVNTACPVPV